MLLTRSVIELFLIVLIVIIVHILYFTFLKYLIAFCTGQPVSASRLWCSIVLVI